MKAALAARCLIAADAGTSEYPDAWRHELIRRANGVLENRVSLFDLGEHYLGTQIDWNFEYKAGKPSPMSYAASIDYRDYAVTGDCKFVWELNRHHHLVILGRAYRLTKEERYARGAAAQMRDWITRCPYGRGMNWRSPLELGIRLINWVCTLELIRDSNVVDDAFLAQLAPVVHLHCREVTRNYSRFSSANNHLIGEAAGVYIASSFFTLLRQASAWKRESRALLLESIREQTFVDGGNCEQAFGYHMFVMQFFLFAALAARNSGDEFPAEYWERLRGMFHFAGAMGEGGDPPMYGDADDGYVLDLGASACDIPAMCCVGATVLGDSELRAAARTFSEPAYWLCGNAGRTIFARLANDCESAELSSKAFAQTGIYLLQCGKRSSRDRISLTLDCGPLGFKSIAAHGHADALSVTLRVGGEDILVDPGTYDYFTYGDWRNVFRATKSHNTIAIDGKDQSEIVGPFMWEHHASARCVEFSDDNSQATVVAEHDGYTRLPRPVKHRRTVRLDKNARQIEIVDELSGRGNYRVDFALHFAEHCQVSHDSSHQYRVHYCAGNLELVFDKRLAVSSFRGSMEPKMGWVSRGYHRKEPSVTLVGTCGATGELKLLTRFRLTEVPETVTCDEAPESSFGRSGSGAPVAHAHPQEVR